MQKKRQQIKMQKKAADKDAKRQQIKMPKKAADKNAKKGSR